jgi:Holliday junction DNA helicase RuvA
MITLRKGHRTKGKKRSAMIGYLEGKLLKKGDDRILVLANQVGYEVLLPAFVMDTFRAKSVGDPVSLYIYHQQTERQPKPVLIGFNLEVEIAIESKNVQTLKQLKGIGDRTARKIIATLEGKMDKFALIRKSQKEEIPIVEDLSQQVLDVLVDQLGYKIKDAKQMITNAMKRNSNISTPEELFEEVYREQDARS